MVNENVLYESANDAEIVSLCDAIKEPDAANDANCVDAGLTVVGFDLSSRHELTWVGFHLSQMRVFCNRPYFNDNTKEVLIGPCQIGVNQSNGVCSSGLYVEVMLEEGECILPVSAHQLYLLIDGVSYLHQMGETPLPEDVLAVLAEYNL